MENGEISFDGRVIWVNSDNGCQLRITGMDKVKDDMQTVECSIAKDPSTGFIDVTIKSRHSGFCNNCGEPCEKLKRWLVEGTELLICDACVEVLRADNILVLPLEEEDINV